MPDLYILEAACRCATRLEPSGWPATAGWLDLYLRSGPLDGGGLNEISLLLQEDSWPDIGLGYKWKWEVTGTGGGTGEQESLPSYGEARVIITVVDATHANVKLYGDGVLLEEYASVSWASSEYPVVMYLRFFEGGHSPAYPEDWYFPKSYYALVKYSSGFQKYWPWNAQAEYTDDWTLALGNAPVVENGYMRQAGQEGETYISYNRNWANPTSDDDMPPSPPAPPPWEPNPPDDYVPCDYVWFNGEIYHYTPIPPEPEPPNPEPPGPPWTLVVASKLKRQGASLGRSLLRE